MPEAKTQPTPASVETHLAAKASASQLPDCQALIALMTRATQAEPTLWGPSIVGFGRYSYRYESGRTGEFCVTGFAVRGRELVVYLVEEGANQAALLARLGPHKLGKSCLYLKRLADIDLDVLAALVAQSVAAVRDKHGA